MGVVIRKNQRHAKWCNEIQCFYSQNRIRVVQCTVIDGSFSFTFTFDFCLVPCEKENIKFCCYYYCLFTGTISDHNASGIGILSYDAINHNTIRVIKNEVLGCQYNAQHLQSKTLKRKENKWNEDSFLYSTSEFHDFAKTNSSINSRIPSQNKTQSLSSHLYAFPASVCNPVSQEI